MENTYSDTITQDQINQPGLNDKIFFYPKEFYVFDNFSSFQVEYNGYLWATSEHAFQAAGFRDVAENVVEEIKNARSAHDAQKIAYSNQELLRKDWDNEKFKIMKEILIAKVKQHPYVLKKLMESGDREIIEDSWRDETWGWGPNKDGKNMLGKIWMEVRAEFQKSIIKVVKDKDE